MSLKKYLKTISAKNKGQVILEYFILLTIITALALIAINRNNGLLDRIRGTVGNYQSNAISSLQ